jgi:pyridoxal phosphate enzyme (YggS family)
MSEIPRRWKDLQNQVGEVCTKIGRDPAAVKVVAVSKVHPAAAVKEAITAGITDFGENKVQEAASKIEAVQPRPVWHLVGHLQTNKAAKAAKLFDWVQSVDSVRVADALGRGAEVAGRDIGVLIQVNTTQEVQKSGCSPDEAVAVVEAVMAQPRLNLRGLMTIGPESADELSTRGAFQLATRIREKWRGRLPEGHMDILSMGMSGDWAWALEHGADWLRIGTAIFGPRNR